MLGVSCLLLHPDTYSARPELANEQILITKGNEVFSKCYNTIERNDLPIY